MNKGIKLSFMAGVCAFFVILPTSAAYADDLILTDEFSYSYGSSDDLIMDDSIMIDDSYLSDSYVSNDIYILDDVIVSGGSRRGDNIISDTIIIDEDPVFRTNTSYPVISDIIVDDSIGRNVTNYGNSGRDVIVSDQPSNRSGNDIIITDSDKNPVEDKTTQKKTTKKTKTTTSKKTKKSSNITDTDNNNTKSSVSDKQAVIDEINILRSQAGVGSLRLSDALNRVADARVQESVVRFSHIRPNGKTNITILAEYGVDYNMSGENITRCVSTPAEAVAAWHSSYTHNRCMLNSGYSQAGVGTTTVNGITYWVLILTD